MYDGVPEERLKIALRRLCRQGKDGPAGISITIALVLAQRGYAERISEDVWVPTHAGRQWCDSVEQENGQGA